MTNYDTEEEKKNSNTEVNKVSEKNEKTKERIVDIVVVNMTKDIALPLAKYAKNVKNAITLQKCASQGKLTK